MGACAAETAEPTSPPKTAARPKAPEVPAAQLAWLAGARPAAVFALPAELTEISGLVPADDADVFAVNDEVATIYRLRLADGAIVDRFSLGKPKAKGDFEGIAVADGFLYLITSDGVVFETRVDAPADGKRRRFNTYDLGLKKACEIEGLTTDEDGALIIACKKAADDPGRETIVMYRWRHDQRLTSLTPYRTVDLRAAAPSSIGRFAAAGLERGLADNHLFVVDSKDGTLLELTGDGARVDHYRLPAQGHPQSEGVALMPDGAVVIADEGVDGPGALTIYRPGAN